MVRVPQEGRQRTTSGSQHSPSSMPAPAILRRAALPGHKRAPLPRPLRSPNQSPAVESLDSTGEMRASKSAKTENDVTLALLVEKGKAVPAEEEAAILEAVCFCLR